MSFIIYKIVSKICYLTYFINQVAWKYWIASSKGTIDRVPNKRSRAVRSSPTWCGCQLAKYDLFNWIEIQCKDPVLQWCCSNNRWLQWFKCFQLLEVNQRRNESYIYKLYLLLPVYFLSHSHTLLTTSVITVCATNKLN